MNAEAVKATEDFVAKEFEKHPHYSFNDWTVMYEHSRKVRDLALTIAEGTDTDSTVVAIGALLHDIGKTYETDAETLHKDHENFNLPVSRVFLRTLELSEEQLYKIECLIQHKSESIEMQIIEDADALALYADKRLYMLYIKWARENQLDAAIQRKLDKFTKLHFQKSRDIGQPWLAQMKLDWGL